MMLSKLKLVPKNYRNLHKFIVPSINRSFSGAPKMNKDGFPQPPGGSNKHPD
jgi:hypothetical protein